MILTGSNPNPTNAFSSKLKPGDLGRVWQQHISIHPLRYERLLKVGVFFSLSLAYLPFTLACLVACLCLLYMPAYSSPPLRLKFFAQGDWLLTINQVTYACKVMQIRHGWQWSRVKLKLPDDSVRLQIVWHHQLNVQQLRRFFVVAQAYQSAYSKRVSRNTSYRLDRRKI